MRRFFLSAFLSSFHYFKRPLNSLRQLFQIIFIGYPKVSEILMGRLAPKSRKHRQTISKAAKHIYQRLSVCDVMPYLLQKGVINTFDMQEVKATAATCEAAIELLLLLPNRSRQWYCLLIEALVESNQCELAQLIDKKMTEGNKVWSIKGIHSFCNMC